MDVLKVLKVRLYISQESCVRNLHSQLQSLQSNVARAIEALNKGQALDENLIQNAGGFATHIAKYNLGLELAPYLEAPEPELDPKSLAAVLK